MAGTCHGRPTADCRSQAPEDNTDCSPEFQKGYLSRQAGCPPGDWDWSNWDWSNMECRQGRQGWPCRAGDCLRKERRAPRRQRGPTMVAAGAGSARLAGASLQAGAAARKREARFGEGLYAGGEFEAGWPADG